MQAIARLMLSPSGQGDELPVVRLSSRSNEAFGDVDTARSRIDGVARKGVTYVFGFQAKYTGTPSSTITSPGHVVAGRYTNSTSRMVAAPMM